MKEILNDQKRHLEEFSNKTKTIVEDNILFSNFKNTKKIVVSDDLARNLINKVHAKMGHIGPKQMELALFPYFYNTNFKKLIKHFCHNCSVCIKNKSRIPYHFGSLSQLGPATEPFEIMSIDTVGGMTGNNSPKKYFHLLVDHFTRYAFALTSKNQKANDFIKLLNMVLKDGHKIKVLLADQYTGINSGQFKKFLHDHEIDLVLTSVDCPSSNGLNERLNQTLVNRLRCKMNESDQNKKGHGQYF